MCFPGHAVHDAQSLGISTFETPKKQSRPATVSRPTHVVTREPFEDKFQGYLT